MSPMELIEPFRSDDPAPSTPFITTSDPSPLLCAGDAFIVEAGSVGKTVEGANRGLETSKAMRRSAEHEPMLQQSCRPFPGDVQRELGASEAESCAPDHASLS